MSDVLRNYIEHIVRIVIICFINKRYIILFDDIFFKYDKFLLSGAPQDLKHHIGAVNIFQKRFLLHFTPRLYPLAKFLKYPVAFDIFCFVSFLKFSFAK